VNDVARETKPRVTSLHDAYTRDADACLRVLGSSRVGLSAREALARLVALGPNALPEPREPGLARTVIRQFANPLVYTLVGAAVLAVAVGDSDDAIVIAIVLAVDAAIGAVQEYGAARSARTLRALTVEEAVVVRDGLERRIPSAGAVPGDIVRVDAGMKVPADLRLLPGAPVEVDESLLTGDSIAEVKDGSLRFPLHTPMADRANQLFAGTLVTRGRAVGVVVETGMRTQIGRIAHSLGSQEETRAPLQVRMDDFARRVAGLVAAAVAILAGLAIARGEAFRDVFFLGIALAVAAIPEGLPVSLTVALAIASRRMAKRQVIARRLVAIEALGSCTAVATDKTGTLTVNELTVRQAMLVGCASVDITGEGIVPEGSVACTLEGRPTLLRLAEACALCNDASLHAHAGVWQSSGDAVDIALLAFARKCGVDPVEVANAAPRVQDATFDPARRYAATRHRRRDDDLVIAKGAPETILRMCDRAATPEGDVLLDPLAVTRAAEALAAAGYRTLAVAVGERPRDRWSGPVLGDELQGLVLLGVLAMIDPLKPEARDAIARCRGAGIRVVMLTGDHPLTALAIARELDLAATMDDVVTGTKLGDAMACGHAEVDELVRNALVFARIEPMQKLALVESLTRLGHFVAMTGDGANDAPALRAAHLGVAMGKRGTALARESASLVLANDDFSSIVAGVEEGRVAYANVRKVTYLLVSCGLAEVFLFVATTSTGLPPPLLPMHLLWLNLVTNGIQDVALAFEPAEGGELERPPRDPSEPIFDAQMLERTFVTAATMAATSYAVFSSALARDTTLADARNAALLTLVLAETIQAGNSRSELRSALTLAPARNTFLLAGSLAALGIHVAAMHLPLVQRVLHLEPVADHDWALAAAGALILFVVAEVHKFALRRRAARPARQRRSPSSVG
jgi:magnesium-transporting ATPase (P-type)